MIKANSNITSVSEAKPKALSASSTGTKANARIFAEVTLQPGESQQWFSNGRDPNKIRLYSAVPIFPPPNQPKPNFDQMVQITQVFELLFGEQHAQNEVGNLQTNVVVTNLNTGPGQVVLARILEAEI